ncbi:hypothetical protein [Lentilactobacillus sp. Marseille-Q4993]|uniref:hypothetical protein n=1 Tax=Lentilactobacillus sp. Marseille-Q4993 TaxID=3039492 RepID=UPI0024BC2131|nr:hypothetical protein [Lentilactobacillus sp. Marseille-Q4993]
MRKLFLVPATILLSLSLAGCNNKKDSKPASKINTAQPIPENKIGNVLTQDKYYQIKVGNILTGKGGDTKKAVLHLLGKEDYRQNTKIAGTKKKAVQYYWKELATSFKASNVSVRFYKDRVIAKGYTAANVAGSKTTSVSKIKTIKKGDSYKSVITDLGYPNGDSISGTGKYSGGTLVYLTDRKGSTANINIQSNKVKAISYTKANN